MIFGLEGVPEILPLLLPTPPKYPIPPNLRPQIPRQMFIQVIFNTSQTSPTIIPKQNRVLLPNPVSQPISQPALSANLTPITLPSLPLPKKLLKLRLQIRQTELFEHVIRGDPKLARLENISAFCLVRLRRPRQPLQILLSLPLLRDLGLVGLEFDHLVLLALVYFMELFVRDPVEISVEKDLLVAFEEVF